MKMIDRLRPEEAFPRLGVWGRAVLGRAGGSGGRLLRGLRTHQGNHPPEHLIDSLAEEGLFASLKRKDLLTVVRLGELLSFEPGEKILSEGDRGLALYLISIGEVKMMRKGASPPPKLDRGDPFGEMSSPSGQPWSAEVEATGLAKCLTFSRWSFEALLHLFPEIQKR
jgi:CRP-like cAMP-binding protein